MFEEPVVVGKRKKTKAERRIAAKEVRKRKEKQKESSARDKKAARELKKKLFDETKKKPRFDVEQFAKKKKSAKDAALDAKKKVLRGVHNIHRKKVRTSVHFHRPNTLKLPRMPRYPRKVIPSRDKMDNYTILRYPITTESGMKSIECRNTLVFIVDVRASKPQIKNAFQQQYKTDVKKVNTLILPNNSKKAFIKLPDDVDAMDIANKLGFL